MDKAMLELILISTAKGVDLGAWFIEQIDNLRDLDVKLFKRNYEFVSILLETDNEEAKNEA